MLLSWIRSHRRCRRSKRSSHHQASAVTSGAAFSLMSRGECSALPVRLASHICDDTMEWTDTQPPFHLQPIQPPTATAATKTRVVLLLQMCQALIFSPLYACCNLPLHSLLLNHTFRKKNFSLLVLFFAPSGTTCSIIRNSALPSCGHVSESATSPTLYSISIQSTSHFTHTHTDTHAESDTSLSRITTSHPQHVISSIFHLLCASSENSCYISLHDKQL